MVINHLLTGMILQVHSPKVATFPRNRGVLGHPEAAFLVIQPYM